MLGRFASLGHGDPEDDEDYAGDTNNGDNGAEEQLENYELSGETPSASQSGSRQSPEVDAEPSVTDSALVLPQPALKNPEKIKSYQRRLAEIQATDFQFFREQHQYWLRKKQEFVSNDGKYKAPVLKTWEEVEVLYVASQPFLLWLLEEEARLHKTSVSQVHSLHIAFYFALYDRDFTLPRRYKPNQQSPVNSQNSVHHSEEMGTYTLLPKLFMCTDA